MKLRSCLILGLALLQAPGLAIGAGGAVSAPSVGAQSEMASELSSKIAFIGDDYKKRVAVTDALFNPFKVQVSIDTGVGHRDDGAVTDESIVSALEARRISGITFASNPAANRVILGDQIFGVGEAVEFFDDRNDKMAPLVSGVRIVLREVKQDSLVFEVAGENAAARRLIFPLHRFWQP
jgi:hypothetical protein